jgi:hypothetical protein
MLSIKLFLECSLCNSKFSSVSSGTPKVTDTFENVINEMLQDALDVHESISPNCPATEEDITAYDSERVTN